MPRNHHGNGNGFHKPRDLHYGNGFQKPRDLHGNGNGNETKLLETDAILLRTCSGCVHFVNTPSCQ